MMNISIFIEVCVFGNECSPPTDCQDNALNDYICFLMAAQKAGQSTI